MKLLFDQNLSPRLATALSNLFPESQHVHAAGLGKATDETVWNYARERVFTIVSKDSDFHERSLLLGYPPKVVWIRRGNCSTREIEDLLREHAAEIQTLASEPEAAFLILL